MTRFTHNIDCGGGLWPYWSEAMTIVGCDVKSYEHIESCDHSANVTLQKSGAYGREYSHLLWSTLRLVVEETAVELAKRTPTQYA